MFQFASRAFPWCAAIIALTFAWIGLDELQYDSARRPQQVQSVLFAFAISVLFGVTAASTWLRWRIRRPAAILCGVCLVLGTISLLTKSWDKVGEAEMVILVIFTGFTAALALISGTKRAPP
jgi:uncharacterized membrane protein